MFGEQQLARERARQRPLHAHFRTARPRTYLQRSHKGRQARRQSRMDSSGQELRRSVLSLCTLHDYPNSRNAYPVRHSTSTRSSASDTQEIVQLGSFRATTRSDRLSGSSLCDGSGRNVPQKPALRPSCGSSTPRRRRTGRQTRPQCSAPNSPPRLALLKTIPRQWYRLLHESGCYKSASWLSRE